VQPTTENASVRANRATIAKANILRMWFTFTSSRSHRLRTGWSEAARCIHLCLANRKKHHWGAVSELAASVHERDVDAGE
jgi:hypothetical protein